MSGSIEIELPASAAAGLICSVTHPLALALGTIPPMVACCDACRLYPPGPPTSWTWPG